MKQFTRKEILDRLHAKMDMGKGLIIGGAGIGLVAQAEEKAGIDVIMAYNTGPYRMDGLVSFMGYMSYSDSNADTMSLAGTILPVVKNTPVVAGVGVSDPYRNPEKMVDEFMKVGFSGITTVPCNGSYEYGIFRKIIDRLDIGVPREAEVMKYCSRNDIFTIEYVFTEEEMRMMCQAGVDVVAIHTGGTVGGTTGKVIQDMYNKSMEEACEHSQRMYEIAKSENPDVIVVNHGSVFTNPEAVAECYRRTDLDGNVGASSVERIPVEEKITELIKAYKSLKLR